MTMRHLNGDSFRLLYLGALLIMAPITAAGQNLSYRNETMDNSIRSSSWLDRETTSEIKSLTEWQRVKDLYETSVAERDSLRAVLAEVEGKKTELISQKHAMQESLSLMQSLLDGTPRQPLEMYSQYDTTILRLHEGHYGNESIEDRQNALLVCHRAESALSLKYDAVRVDEALLTIKPVESLLPAVYEEIGRRLAQYGQMTDDLRRCLSSANGLRLVQGKASSKNMIEKHKREFFAELGKALSPALLDPHAYPYLYSILTEAMSVKKNDPSSDIQELIDKL